jgi:hypothetical protein
VGTGNVLESRTEQSRAESTVMTGPGGGGARIIISEETCQWARQRRLSQSHRRPPPHGAHLRPPRRQLLHWQTLPTARCHR